MKGSGVLLPLGLLLLAGFLACPLSAETLVEGRQDMEVPVLHWTAAVSLPPVRQAGMPAGQGMTRAQDGTVARDSAGRQDGARGARVRRRAPEPQARLESGDGAESGLPLRTPHGNLSDGGDAGPDMDALEAELGQILDECVQEALTEQRKAFEEDYARLWDSRSFWRRVAVGEGCAIAACLFGGFLVWGLGR